MSRRALWQPSAPAAADPGVRGLDSAPAAAPPTDASVAPGATIPVRSAAGSALAAQVKLARLADLLAELSGIVREVAQEALAVHAERALMSNVNEPATAARLLTTRDVAQKLALSERTVRRLRRQGVLPSGIEIAGVIRWRPEEIDAWLASGGAK